MIKTIINEDDQVELYQGNGILVAKSNSVGTGLVGSRSSPVMSPLPTFAAAVQDNGQSTLSQFVNVFVGGDTTKINSLFRYPFGDIRVSKPPPAFPEQLCVSNFAVSNPVDGTVILPGTYNTGLLSVEFQTDAPRLELTCLAKAGLYRILVDEGDGYKYTTNATGYANGTLPNTGAGYLISVAFAGRKLRNIRLDIDTGFFMGVRIGGNDTLTQPSNSPLPKCVVLGDSFTEPTGADNSFTGLGNILCQVVGMEASISGSGGTGYISTGNVPRTNFAGRVQNDVINQNPDYVVIAGGINDGAFTPDAIYAAALSLYTTIQEGLPDAKIFVVGNWFPRAPGDAERAITAALLQAATELGIAFIDPINGTLYASDGTQLITPALGSWLTGSGNTGSVQSTGNASVITGPDNTHPVQYGHNFYGTMVGQGINTILTYENKQT